MDRVKHLERVQAPDTLRHRIRNDFPGRRDYRVCRYTLSVQRAPLDSPLDYSQITIVEILRYTMMPFI
jgi:hypothetical protein